MPIPNVPADFLVQPGNGQVYLSWSPSVGAVAASTGVPVSSSGAYDILRSVDGGVNYSLLTSINTNQYYDSPSTGLVLFYEVRANGNSGQSSPSTPIGVTSLNFGQASLGSIRLAAQQRADMVNNDFVTKQEWNDYINKSYTELYDILVQTYGDEYYVATPFTISFDSRNPPLYNLPSNIYKLLGVDLRVNTNQFITLRKFTFAERNQFQYGNTAAWVNGGMSIKYRLVGNQIEFNITSGSQAARLWYVPRPITLLADFDILDGVSGWEEYIVTDAAIKAMQKEESDVSILMAQKQALLTRITAAANNRDAGMPECATDVQRLNGLFGSNGWNDPYGGF